MEKICKTCRAQQSLSKFRSRIHKNGRTYYESDCKPCEREKNRERCNKRYHEKAEWYKDYAKENKEKKKAYNKEYYKKNTNKLKKYRKTRREKDNENQKAWFKKKRKENPCFKLRQYVSCVIRRMLKKNDSLKGGDSCLEYLNYSFGELKAHIESQFDVWMSWENHGRYDAKLWNDHDEATWTWQLDHIVPQADLPYTSMIDENFNKCWSLANLRPLKAKVNIIDGASRIRHKAVSN